MAVLSLAELIFWDPVNVVESVHADQQALQGRLLRVGAPRPEPDWVRKRKYYPSAYAEGPLEQRGHKAAGGWWIEVWALLVGWPCKI